MPYINIGTQHPLRGPKVRRSEGPVEPHSKVGQKSTSTRAGWQGARPGVCPTPENRRQETGDRKAKVGVWYRGPRFRGSEMSRCGVVSRCEVRGASLVDEVATHGHSHLGTVLYAMSR